MVGVFVRFECGKSFDPAALRKIAQGASSMFAGVPALRSKAFTIDLERREATNFYVWNTEEAARAFFNEQLLERVTSLYGVRPSISFVEIAALVDNHRPN